MQPAVQWYLHEQKIDILYAIPNPTKSRVLGFHIRLPAGEERDIFFGDDGYIDGFGYDETQQ